jgi:hypothetical protein
VDATALTILLQELQADAAVIQDAARKSGLRLEQETAGHLEACAYELSRAYNVTERALERICDAFENHFEKQGDYHERLLQRLSLQVPGIRPTFVPADRLSLLRELKGFRHVVRHAYDLTLRADRLLELSRLARQLADEFPSWCTAFARQVRAEQDWGPE